MTRFLKKALFTCRKYIVRVKYSRDNVLFRHRFFCTLLSAVTVHFNLLFPPCAAYKDHAVLLGKYVSKKAASRRRTVLELLGFDTAEIDSSSQDDPRKGENAVQAGLSEWVVHHPPTTGKVLIDALQDTEIAQQHTEGLKEQLQTGVCACMRACVCRPNVVLLTDGVLVPIAVSG